MCIRDSKEPETASSSKDQPSIKHIEEVQEPEGQMYEEEVLEMMPDFHEDDKCILESTYNSYGMEQAEEDDFADTITLRVFDWNGVISFVTMDPTDTFGDLKDHMENSLEEWGSEMRFTFMGKPLDLEQTFHYYGIPDNGVIMMNGRLKGGVIKSIDKKKANKAEKIEKSNAKKQQKLAAIQEELLELNTFLQQLPPTLDASAIVQRCTVVCQKLLTTASAECIKYLIEPANDEALGICANIKSRSNNEDDRIDTITDKLMDPVITPIQNFIDILTKIKSGIFTASRSPSPKMCLIRVLV